MRTLFWFNASVTFFLLVLWIAIVGWWHYYSDKTLISPIAEQTVQDIRATDDFDRLKKVSEILIRKDQQTAQQVNALIDKGIGVLGGWAQLMFVLFLISTIWTHRISRKTKIAKPDVPLEKDSGRDPALRSD